MSILALLVLAALAYGVFRLVTRRRMNKRSGSGPLEVEPSAESITTDAGLPPGEPVGTNPALRANGAVLGSPTARSIVRHQDSHDEWAVETHGLTKHFGPNIAVNNVELRVPRGCAFGCLGPNGAGKTTLIRVLLGLTRADAGTMSLLGYPVPKRRDKALARIGAIVDEPRFHGHLTGRQNLQILAAAREQAARDRIDASLGRVGMLHRAEDKVSKYSMGMRQRLGVAACLLGDPQLLILDEPMNGLDPAGMLEMREMIQSLAAEGRTVFLSSHLLDEVERTCDAVAIVDKGKVIRQGSIDELLAGASVEIEIDCSSPNRAKSLLASTPFGAHVEARVEGVDIALPAPTDRAATAEINRLLVEGGISVYRLQEVHASLEAWFLEVTNRLGADE